MAVALSLESLGQAVVLYCGFVAALFVGSLVLPGPVVEAPRVQTAPVSATA